MVSFCANPTCNKPLHYLRDGKVFLFSGKNAKNGNPKLPSRLEHYWLCGSCAQTWTLSIDAKDAIQLVESKKRRVRSAYSMAAVAPAS